MSKSEGAGVPLPVRVRAYRVHALIAAVMLVVFGLAFGLLAGDCTRACAELRRIHDAPQSEIVFTGQKLSGAESFFYLTSAHAVGGKGTGVSADILMAMPDAFYGDNDIYFEGTLEAGTCAVSANLASAYGLRVGGRLRFAGEETSFRVARLLTAQAGIDKKFLREGIIVLAYEESLAREATSYVSFTTDNDAYPSLQSLVYIRDWQAENVGTVVLCAAVFAVSFVLAAGVCEFFLFRERMRDYLRLFEMGGKRGRILARMGAENALKYLLPLAVTGAVFAAFYSSYGAVYALPLACCFAAAALMLAAYTIAIGRRLLGCRTNGKQS